MKKKSKKPECMKLQWEKLCVLDGNPVCPSCHEPAEQIIGFFGNPCWGHKFVESPERRRK